jgi:hypothetical protein
LISLKPAGVLRLKRQRATVGPTMARKVRRPVFKMTREMRAFFAETGRQGGKVGGKLRWAGVSQEERTAHAKRAVAAREAKRKKPAK